MNQSDQAHPPSSQSSGYRPEIDGLRAIAVLAVLINHIHHDWLPGGFLGVDLFFVISGYVVTASLARRKETNWRQMLTGFYIRRFRRLLPALLLMVAIVSVIFSVFVSRSSDGYEPSLRTGLASLIGISNLYLLKQGSNYFDFGTQFNPFLHTWSLGVEEQFYMLWPILAMMCGVGIKKDKRQALTSLLIITIILTLGSIIFYAYLLRSSQESAAFYLMPARFWELSAGALVFLMQTFRPLNQHRLLPLRFHSLINFSLGVLVLTGFFLASEPAGQFKPVFVAATAGLLASLRTASSIGRWLSQPSILAVGVSSYSLYLWHWPLIVLLRWTVGIHALTVIPLLVCIALVTSASYWIETKFRFGDIRGIGPRQPIFLYPLAALFTAGFVFSLSRYGSTFIYSGNQKTDPENFSTTRSVRGTSIVSYKCFLEPTAPVEASKNSNECLIRTRPELPTLFLEGDSISHAMIPLLEHVYESHQFNVSFFGRGGCPMPYLEPWTDNRHRLPRYQKCRKHAQLREDFVLKNLKSGDQLVLVTTTYAQSPQSMASYADAISRLAEALGRRGAGLILFSPLPVFAERASIKSPLSLCFPEWFRPSWAIPHECRPFFANREELLQATQPMRELQERLKTKHDNIRVFHPFPLLCPPGQRLCSTHRDGVMFFNDGIHPTATGARSLYPQFQSFLKTIF